MSLHIFRRDQYHTCHFVLFGPLSLLTSLYTPLTHFYALVESTALDSWFSSFLCLCSDVPFLPLGQLQKPPSQSPILQPTLLHPLGHNISRIKI